MDRFPSPDSDIHGQSSHFSYTLFSLVISFAVDQYFPSSGMLPQMIFSMEVLPDPLLPTGQEVSCSIFMLKLSNRHISLMVPGIIVFVDSAKFKHSYSPFFLSMLMTRITRNRTAVIRTSPIACGSKVT